MKNMKGFTIGIIIAVLLLSSLAACNSGNNNSASESPHSGNKDDQGVVSGQVKMAVWGSGYADIYKRIQDNFNAENSNIDLTIEVQGSYWDYIGAKTASNDLPDLFYVSAWEKVQTYAKNGKLQDLSDRPFVSKIYDSLKESLSYEDSIYGFPWSVGMLAIIYNEDAFEKAGIESPPTTISEYQIAVEKLKSAGITPWASSVNTSWTLAHLMSGLQGSLVRGKQSEWMSSMNDGTGSFEIEGTNNLFDFLDSMKTNTVSNYLNADYDAAVQAVATGEAAMFFEGEWAISDALKINPNAKLNIFGPPLSENPKDSVISIDTGGVIVVNKDSKNLQAALAVIDAFADETNEDGYMKQMTAAGATPTMPTKFNVPISNAWDTFQEALAEGKTTEGWLFQQFPSTTIYEQSGSILQGYFANAKSREQVIKELDLEWKQAIK